MAIKDRLDFNVAWKKVKSDLNYENFVNNPYLIHIIESNLTAWIETVKERIENYNPTICPTIDIPKKKWHIRPANILTIEDHLIYSALVLDEIKKIRNSLKWSAKKQIRFSNILMENQKSGRWFKFGMNLWRAFDKKSLELTEEYDYVLFTDISGYFENINIKRMIADLEDIGINKENKDLMSQCLNTWAMNTEKGLPQGYVPSSVLAEIYFNTIDKQLFRDGFIHTRYVDDIRIFCESHKDATKGLHMLTQLCRDKGLNIQTAKSDIMARKEALLEINGISPIINQTDKQIIKDLNLDNDYTTPRDVRKHPQIDSESLFLEITFSKYFLSKNEFNSKLFHYLLNRLVTPIAVGYCCELIFKHPEETKYILNYFTHLHYDGLDLTNIAEDLANKILLEKDVDYLIYEYQKYLFVKWLWETEIVSDNLLMILRNVAKLDYEIPNIKNYSIAYLGEHGDSADSDFISSLYGRTENEITKSIIVYALRNMHKSRRNSIYNRVSGEGGYVEFAVKCAKSVP